MRSLQQSGVVLLEVLAAFSILAVSLTVLLQVASANVNRHTMIENRLTAVTHANNVLSEIGVSLPLDKHELTGRIDEQYSWQMKVQELGSIELDRDTAETSPSLISIDLRINWQEGAANKHYSVNTKRIVWRR